ncbi:MAG TPA: DUF4157 domain-containing protein [Phycisphaerae bacterium]
MRSHADKKSPVPSGGASGFARGKQAEHAREPALILQRSCSCGGEGSSLSGECEECAAKRLQKSLIIGQSNDPYEQQADQVASAVMHSSRGKPAVAPAITPVVRRAPARSSRAPAAPAAAVAPPIVHSVLSSSGAALDPSARSFFEPRFGHNFGDVRVHTDAQAAQSARMVGARAYAVGNHLVFGDSQYAPHTSAGRHLLAHELTHVLQQAGGLKRSSISPEQVGEVGDDSSATPAQPQQEEEPPVQAMLLQRHPAIVGLDEAGPNADLTGQKEADMYNLSQREAEEKKKLEACEAMKPSDPVECDPATALSWSDFKATAPAQSQFSAATASDITTVDVPSTKCITDAKGIPSGPLKRFQAVFHPNTSWVKPSARDAADPTKNGSAAEIAKCEKHFDDSAAKNFINVTYHMSSAAVAACPASIRAAGNNATTKGGCTTVVGADFTATAIAESARLLNHEQNHFNLTCALAKKGNALLAAGGDFDKINAVINTRLATTQAQYDADAHHGCNAAGQSKWEAAISSGLPTVKLP